MPQTIEVRVTCRPSAYYTLLAHSDCIVKRISEAGAVALPAPRDVVPSTFIPQYPSDAVVTHALDILGANSFAHVEADDELLAMRVVRDRQSAVAAQLRNYGLPADHPSRAPWHDLEFTDPDGAATCRIASEFLSFKDGLSAAAIDQLISQLDAVPAVGPEITEMLDYVQKRLRSAFDRSVATPILRDFLIWVYKGEEGVTSHYPVQPRTHVAMIVEPYNKALLQGAVITLEVKRMEPGPRGGRVELGLTAVDQLAKYWSDVAAKDYLDSRDIEFLDWIIFNSAQALPPGQAPDFSHAARLALVQEIVAECHAAIALFQAHVHVSSLIGDVGQFGDFSTDPNQNAAAIAAAIAPEVAADATIAGFRNDLAQQMAMFARPPAPPPQRGALPALPVPPLRVTTRWRLLNEVRQSIAFRGRRLTVSERAGYLAGVPGAPPRYDPNFYCWTRNLPVDLSIGDLPPQWVGPPAEAWADADLPAANTLSAIEDEVYFSFAANAAEVVNQGDLDGLATFIREFDYAKVRAGLAIAEGGLALASTQRQMNEVYWRDLAARRWGYMFPPEASIIVANHAAEGSFVRRGDPIATLTPIYRFAVRVIIEVGAGWSTFPFTGQKLQGKLLDPVALHFGPEQSRIAADPYHDVIVAALRRAFAAACSAFVLDCTVVSATPVPGEQNKTLAEIVCELPEAARGVRLAELPAAVSQGLRQAGATTRVGGAEVFVLDGALFPEGLQLHLQFARPSA